MKFSEKRIDGEYTIFTTIQCPRWLGGCSTKQEIKVFTKDVERYSKGLMIQQAFPYLDDNQRERLISGICGVCWDKMFAERDDDEPYPGDAGEEEPKPVCNGMCVFGRDILEPEDAPGVDLSQVAYPHPDCPEHGQPTGADYVP